MILVTGGAGYIGCVMVKALLDKGFPVRVVDKLWFGDSGLKELRGEIELVQGDIRHLDPCVLNGVSDVIHLAGLSNDPMSNFNPEANHEINTLATQTLGKACKKAGMRRFLFASTCSVYDWGLHAEDSPRGEDAEVHPRAAYAVSKYEAERALLELKSPDFSPIIFRLGTVYGFSSRLRFDLVVNTFLKDALSKGSLKVDCGGEMWRPLIDVTDVARAFITALEVETSQVSGEIWNLVYKNYRILELAHWVKEALKETKTVDIQVDYAVHQVRSYRALNQKIQTRLGFKPSISVKDSVSNLLQQLKGFAATDFSDSRYYNIKWFTQLCEMEELLRRMGTVL